jgi:hypothetical protein
MKTAIAVFCAVLVATSCEVFREPVPAHLGDDERAVLGDFLEDTFPGDGGSYCHLDPTAGFYVDDMSRLELPVSRSTVRDFVRRNRVPAPFSRKTEFGHGVRIDFDQEAIGLFGRGRDGWQLYYDKFAGGRGIADVSRVGIDKSGTEALVYFGMRVHWLGGSGHYVLLRWKDGRWSEVGRQQLWVS